MSDVDSRGARLKLDKSRVPHDLLELVPLVERWGFSRQEEQDAYATLMRKTPNAIHDFNTQIDRFRERIIQWGNNLDHRTNESESHPYWSFLDALKIRELTEEDDSPKMQQARNRISSEVRMHKFGEAVRKSEQLFRQKRFGEFVAILAPFADLLSEAQSAKVALAKKRI